MEIQVQGKDRFLFVHSVIITKNQEHPKQADILWCYSCGENIARIKGKISQIRAGEIGTNEIAAIRECAKCRNNNMLKKILCWLGYHEWKYDASNTRCCWYCKTTQGVFDTDFKKLFKASAE